MQPQNGTSQARVHPRTSLESTGYSRHHGNSLIVNGIHGLLAYVCGLQSERKMRSSSTRVYEVYMYIVGCCVSQRTDKGQGHVLFETETSSWKSICSAAMLAQCRADLGI